MPTTRRMFMGACLAAGAAAGFSLSALAPLAEARRGGYSTSTDPFALDQRLKALAAKIAASPGARMKPWTLLSYLFHYLSGPDRPKAVEMAGKPPRTASEAFAYGGDFTDRATIVIALFKELKIPGGAMLVRFAGSKSGPVHMAPYAMMDGKRIIIDVMAGNPGQIEQGNGYYLLMDMTYGQAAGMYHREMGDYLRGKGDRKTALLAYKRSLELNEKDPYVHICLAMIYEDAGDFGNSLRHTQRAAQLDPGYKRYLPGAVYNAAIAEGKKAYQEGRYADCAAQLEKALGSGVRLPAERVQAIKGSIAHCRQRAGR